MAATTLVKEAMWRVAVLLNDENPQFAFWEEHELVNWFDDAQMALATYVPHACSRLDAVKLVAGSRQSIDAIAAANCKPGDGSTPGVTIHGKKLLSIVRNMGADGATPGRAVRPFDRETLDAINPDWHTQASTDGVVHGYAYDVRAPHYFYVKPPIPGSALPWVEMLWVVQPLPLPNTGTVGAELYALSGTNTTTLSIDDEFVQDLVNYVVARAYMKVSKQGDPSKAAAFASMFITSINTYVTALTGVSPRLTAVPGLST